MTPDEECSSARIRIDNLHAWALHRQPDNVGFDSAGGTATIDIRNETLGTTMIGDTRISLVRLPHTRFGLPGQDTDRQFSFANVVCWKVEGPVKLRAVVEEWIGHFESFAGSTRLRGVAASYSFGRGSIPGDSTVE